MTFGSKTFTYHLAYLAVSLFMFLSVSVFLESMSAGRAWPLFLEAKAFEPNLLRDG